MRLFICLLDPTGRGIPLATRRRYEALPRSRGVAVVQQSVSHAWFLAGGNDAASGAMIASQGDIVAVGLVRLDNRIDLEQWAECPGARVSDLDLVLRVVARHGTKYVPRFLGDFSFVAWNNAARTAIPHFVGKAEKRCGRDRG